MRRRQEADGSSRHGKHRADRLYMGLWLPCEAYVKYRRYCRNLGRSMSSDFFSYVSSVSANQFLSQEDLDFIAEYLARRKER